MNDFYFCGNQPNLRKTQAAVSVMSNPEDLLTKDTEGKNGFQEKVSRKC